MVSAYRVDRCGYYRRGAHDASFGSFPDTAAELSRWTSGKQIRNTCTRVMSDDAEAETEGLVCNDVAVRGEQYLFQMWDRAAEDGGTIGVLAGEALVGAAAPEPFNVTPGGIPGATRLYWLVPDLRLMCTVRLHRRATARNAFEQYVRDFLTYTSPWAATSREGEGIAVRAYAPIGAAASDRYFPRFKTRPLADLSRVEEIRRRRSQIVGISYDGKMGLGEARTELNDATGLLKQILGFQGRLASASQAQRGPRPRVKVSVALPYNPTEVELEALIDQAAASTTAVSADVGFHFEGGSRDVVWIGQRTARQRLPIEVPRDQDGHISSDEFLQALGPAFLARLRTLVEADDAVAQGSDTVRGEN